MCYFPPLFGACVVLSLHKLFWRDLLCRGYPHLLRVCCSLLLPRAHRLFTVVVVFVGGCGVWEVVVQYRGGACHVECVCAVVCNVSHEVAPCALSTSCERASDELSFCFHGAVSD